MKYNHAVQPAPEPVSDSVQEDERLSPPPATSQRRELLGVLGVFAAVTAACAALWQLRRVVPFVARNLHAMIAAIFLYVPTYLLSRRREDFERYALTHRPVGRSLVVFGVASAIVFPLFAVSVWFYYRLVCAGVARGLLLPRTYYVLCRRFVGDWRAVRLRWPTDFGQRVLAQLVVVALPEEYFFRGYLQSRLETVWPSRRRLLGAPVGLSLIVASVLFALGHVLVDFNALRLAVFFPALAFGWMRQATGSILAGVLFHASCNLISEVLHAMLF